MGRDDSREPANGRAPDLPPWVHAGHVVPAQRDVALELETATLYLRCRGPLDLRDTVVTIRVPHLLELCAGVTAQVIVPQLYEALGIPLPVVAGPGTPPAARPKGPQA